MWLVFPFPEVGHIGYNPSRFPNQAKPRMGSWEATHTHTGHVWQANICLQSTAAFGVLVSLPLFYFPWLTQLICIIVYYYFPSKCNNQLTIWSQLYNYFSSSCSDGFCHSLFSHFHTLEIKKNRIGRKLKRSSYPALCHKVGSILSPSFLADDCLPVVVVPPFFQNISLLS